MKARFVSGGGGLVAVVLVLCMVVLTRAGKAASTNKCAPDSNYLYPFKPSKSLPFCHEFNALSCCDVKDVKAIQKTTQESMKPECSICFEIFSKVKCSECHPNAAQFWVNEASSVKLCEGFCHALYDACKDIPFRLGDFNPDGSSAAFYINDHETTAEEFCEDLIAPEPNCYEADVPEGSDENCKCPTLDCHLDVERPPQEPMVHKIKLEWPDLSQFS